MATNNSSKRTTNTLRCGSIKSTIWQNVSEKGPFFAWRNGVPLGLNYLEDLIPVKEGPIVTAYTLASFSPRFCFHQRPWRTEFQ